MKVFNNICAKTDVLKETHVINVEQFLGKFWQEYTKKEKFIFHNTLRFNMQIKHFNHWILYNNCICKILTKIYLFINDVGSKLKLVFFYFKTFWTIHNETRDWMRFFIPTTLKRRQLTWLQNMNPPGQGHTYKSSNQISII